MENKTMAISLILLSLIITVAIFDSLTSEQNNGVNIVKDFCPTGDIVETTGFGEHKLYCDGKQFICSNKKCNWINNG